MQGGQVSIEEQIDKLREMESTLPPFTITITDPKEATALVSAYIMQASGSRQAGMLFSAGLGVAVRELGIEKGIDDWLSLFTDVKPPMPRFLRPLLIHYFTHMKAELEKGKQ